MTKVLHIIGQQGVGKSTLARQIQSAYTARKLSCVNLTDLGLHEPGWNTDIRPFREHGVCDLHQEQPRKLDVLIVEHLDQPHPKQIQTGDLILRMEVAP